MSTPLITPIVSLVSTENGIARYLVRPSGTTINRGSGVEYVSARKAAQLLGVNEKTIRRWVKAGRFPGAIKRSATLIDIPVSELRAEGEPVIDRIKRVEVENERLHAELASIKSSIEAIMRSKTPPEGQEQRIQQLDLSRYHYPIVTPSSGRPNESVPIAFTSPTETARFLLRHGVSDNTSRRWPGLPNTPRAALEYARNHVIAMGYRAASIHLHQCNIPECPCHSLWGDTPQLGGDSGQPMLE